MFLFLTSFFNKNILYIGLGVLIISGILFWQHSIKVQAQLEFNNKQLQQTIKEQETYINNLNKLNEDQKVILNNLDIQNKLLQNNVSITETYLTSSEAIKDNKESSIILKNTFRQLGKIQ